MPYNVNGGKRTKMHPLFFYWFSGASNLRRLQATYLKFAEYVDILMQIIYAKLKEGRTKDNGYIDARKWKRTLNKNSEKNFSSLYFIVVLQYIVQIAIVRDTDSNLLIQ